MIGALLSSAMLPHALSGDDESRRLPDRESRRSSISMRCNEPHSEAFRMNSEHSVSSSIDSRIRSYLSASLRAGRETARIVFELAKPKAASKAKPSVLGDVAESNVWKESSHSARRFCAPKSRASRALHRRMTDRVLRVCVGMVTALLPRYEFARSNNILRASARQHLIFIFPIYEPGGCGRAGAGARLDGFLSQRFSRPARPLLRNLSPPRLDGATFLLVDDLNPPPFPESRSVRLSPPARRTGLRHQFGCRGYVS